MRQRRNKIQSRVAVGPDGCVSIEFFAVVAATLLTTMIAVPAFAVLPVVASVALACAVLLSLAARWPGFKSRCFLLRDFAGAAAFVGVAGAIFCTPRQVVETFALLAR